MNAVWPSCSISNSLRVLKYEILRAWHPSGTQVCRQGQIWVFLEDLHHPELGEDVIFLMRYTINWLSIIVAEIREKSRTRRKAVDIFPSLDTRSFGAHHYADSKSI
jgi:hypothetical protein